MAEQLERLGAEASAGRAPAPAAPDPALASAAVRVAIDYADAAELAAKAAKAVQALRADSPPMWRMLRVQGVFLGRGAPGKVAFLYTGQGPCHTSSSAKRRLGVSALVPVRCRASPSPASLPSKEGGDPAMNTHWLVMDIADTGAPAPFSTRVAGAGRRLPPTHLTTDELMASTRHHTHIDLERLTGIHERRVSTGDEDSYSLATMAALDCLDKAQQDSASIDVVINCSITKFRSGLTQWLEPSMRHCHRPYDRR